jgi:hypothetical protein
MCKDIVPLVASYIKEKVLFSQLHVRLSLEQLEELGTLCPNVWTDESYVERVLKMHLPSPDIDLDLNSDLKKKLYDDLRKLTFSMGRTNKRTVLSLLTLCLEYEWKCGNYDNDHFIEYIKIPQPYVGIRTATSSADQVLPNRAIYEAFHPDKINYAAYGDGYPHVHFHLVPKYRGGKSWGSPFDLAEDPAGKVSGEDLGKTIELLKSKL